MTPRVAIGEAKGPVLAGLLTPYDMDDVLRRAFREADARGATVTVVAAGAAGHDEHATALHEAVARWSEKYPGVAVTTARRPRFDAAIALTAGTAGCGLAVLGRPTEARLAAVLTSVVRRAHCPVLVVLPEPVLPEPGLPVPVPAVLEEEPR